MTPDFIGNIFTAFILVAAVARYFPYQTENNKDAMRVDNERIWK